MSGTIVEDGRQSLKVAFPLDSFPHFHSASASSAFPCRLSFSYFFSSLFFEMAFLSSGKGLIDFLLLLLACHNLGVSAQDDYTCTKTKGCKIGCCGPL